MIVEDEIILARSCELVLDLMGYSICDIVTSGEEAIEKAALRKPEVVLMDIKLSGEMDGIEAGNHINSSLGIPVIYITGFSSEEEKERAGITEPHQYLVKPVDAPDLDRAIRLTLDR